MLWVFGCLGAVGVGVVLVLECHRCFRYYGRLNEIGVRCYGCLDVVEMVSEVLWRIGSVLRGTKGSGEYEVICRI